MSQTPIGKMLSRQIARVAPAASPSAQEVLIVKPPKEPGKDFKVKVRTVQQQQQLAKTKFLRYRVDMESVNNAYNALPYAYKFFWMIYRLSPVRTVVIISVYLLQGLLPALRLRTGGDFINQLQEGIQSGTMNSRNLVRLAITQAFTYILEQSAWTLLHNMEDKTQHRLAAEMDIALMKAHLRLDISQMMDKEIKDAFQRAQSTLAIKPIDLLTRQLSFFQGLTSVIAESIALASMTPRRAWIMIMMSTISPFAQNILSRWYQETAFGNPEQDTIYNEQLTRAETMKFYAHSLAMRPELAIFGLKNWVVQEYQKSSSIVAELDQPVQPNSFQSQVYNHIVNFAQTGTRAMMYLLVALKSDYFGIPLPSLAYLEQSTQSLFNHTWGLYSRMGYVLHDLMAIQELFECMEMQPAMKAPEIPAEYESAEDRSDKGMKIELRNVSFKYPEQNEFVLKDVSFVLEAGETLALLGFNGSGKSTLIKLLTRLFDPTAGEILINDVDIKEYNREDLYERMSILFQDYRICHKTFFSRLTIEKFVPLRVAENIAAGDVEHHDDQSIHRAAVDGGADAFIQQLPLKYDTKLRDSSFRAPPRRRRVIFGGAFIRSRPSSEENKNDPSRPVDLSGGQWQRLALSRSFMRASTADLLVLDEPSSSLDPEAEHNLFRFIQQVRRNKTMIYVTHRFYTVRMATKIAFLEEGKLIEWGGHNELMKIEGGKYAKLFQLQSEGFSALGQGEEGE